MQVSLSTLCIMGVGLGENNTKSKQTYSHVCFKLHMLQISEGHVK